MSNRTVVFQIESLRRHIHKVSNMQYCLQTVSGLTCLFGYGCTSLKASPTGHDSKTLGTEKAEASEKAQHIHRTFRPGKHKISFMMPV